jgi:hypothetical protein
MKFSANAPIVVDLCCIRYGGILMKKNENIITDAIDPV